MGTNRHATALAISSYSTSDNSESLPRRRGVVASTELPTLRLRGKRSVNYSGKQSVKPLGRNDRGRRRYQPVR